MKKFTISQTGQSADIAKGDTFEVDLPENPATGFQWKIIAAGEPILTVAGSDFHAAPAVGGSGMHLWQFHARQAGEANLRMVLERSWGVQPAEPTQSFALRVSVSS